MSESPPPVYAKAPTWSSTLRSRRSSESEGGAGKYYTGRKNCKIDQILTIQNRVLSLAASILTVAMGGLLSLCTPGITSACDLHPVFEPTTIEALDQAVGSWNSGVAYQFTHYESNIRQPGFETFPGQYVESSITQVYGSYQILEQLSAQLSLPFIYRDFKRIVEGQVDKGSVSGVGDMSLRVGYQPYDTHNENSATHWDLFSALKLPTGDTDRLREEREAFDNRSLLRHGGGSDGGTLVFGDDLTLGSGSYDWTLGTSILTQYEKWMFSASAQYVIRQDGDYGYHFGDGFFWDIGPGYYLFQEAGQSLLARVRVQGEWKDKDRIKGETLSDSDDSRVYVGGELVYALDNSWTLSVAGDGAVDTESSVDGVTPRYRVQAAVNYSPVTFLPR